MIAGMDLNLLRIFDAIMAEKRHAGRQFAAHDPAGRQQCPEPPAI